MMKTEVIPKLVLAVLLPVTLLTGALVIGKTQQSTAQDTMPQQQMEQDRMSRESTAKGIPREIEEKLRAQFARVKVAEDEARALFHKKQYAAAEAACRRALAITPKIQGKTINIRAWQLLGQIYMEQGRYREALPFLHEAAIGTRDDALSLDTALCYFRLGDLKKARQLYSDLMMMQDSSIEPEYLPGTRTAKTLEASILFARGMNADTYAQTEKAERDFSAAARLAPTNAMIAYRQAMALKELNRSPEALSCFTRAVAYGKSGIVEESTYQLSLWPDAERQKALKEAARLKAAKS